MTISIKNKFYLHTGIFKGKEYIPSEISFYLCHADSYNQSINILSSKYPEIIFYDNSGYCPKMSQKIRTWDRFKETGRFCNLFGSWPGLICFSCFDWFPCLEDGLIIQNCYRCQMP